MERTYRVLYIHGLKGGPGSPKVKLLNQAPRLEVRCVKMFWPWVLLPYWLWRQAREIKSFHPDIVVGSSYGAALLGILVQIGIWRGPTLYLSQALTRIFPHRAWLHRDSSGVFLHGRNDTVIPIEQTLALTKPDESTTCLNMVVAYNDDHRLRSVLDSSNNTPIQLHLDDRIVDNPSYQPRRLDLIITGMLDHDIQAYRRVNSPVGMVAAGIMIAWVTVSTVGYWVWRAVRRVV